MPGVVFPVCWEIKDVSDAQPGLFLLALDTGATAQMQQAAVLAEAAEAAKKAKPETQKQERQAKAQQQEIDQEMGGILSEPALADWLDADLSTAFRNAQSKDVRLQLANELSRRRSPATGSAQLALAPFEG